MHVALKCKNWLEQNPGIKFNKFTGPLKSIQAVKKVQSYAKRQRWRKLWNTDGSQEMAVMVGQLQKFNSGQCVATSTSLGIGTKLPWIVIIFFYGPTIPSIAWHSQPELFT